MERRGPTVKRRPCFISAGDFVLESDWRCDALRGFEDGAAYLWLAGNEGLDKNMEATIMGFLGTTTASILTSRAGAKARDSVTNARCRPLNIAQPSQKNAFGRQRQF